MCFRHLAPKEKEPLDHVSVEKRSVDVGVVVDVQQESQQQLCVASDVDGVDALRLPLRLGAPVAAAVDALVAALAVAAARFRRNAVAGHSHHGHPNALHSLEYHQPHVSPFSPSHGHIPVRPDPQCLSSNLSND